MKALVTGATGFIGGHVTRHLLDAGVAVRVLVRPRSDTRLLEGLPVDVAWGDVADVESVRRAIEGCQAVYHGAALYAFWHPDPAAFHRTNVEGTRNVLEAALRAGVQRVVYTSTTAAVGLRPGGLPADEASDPQTSDLLGAYKRTKYLAEVEARQFAARGLPVVIVNPSAPVGWGDVKPTPTGRVVLDFLKGRMFAYLDTGLNLVDVEDVARGHLLAFEKGRPGERYILGNRNMALREVFQALATITGRPAPKRRVSWRLALAIAYMDSFVEGTLLRQAPFLTVTEVRLARKPMYYDASRAVRELGLPQSPVERALEKAVDWFERQGYVRHRRLREVVA
ncbi:MAG: NAD-dependent epimerase/dehydratase family protein [Chloroflexi bacterium]|nr:NAD-dependent epimerase/dehydratase family protein [Chloroflexota bacterium]